MKRSFILLLTLFTLTLSAQSYVEDAAELLAKGKYAKLHRSFTPDLQKQVSKKQLKTIWEHTVSTFGDFQAALSPKSKSYQDELLETALLKFETGSFQLQITHKEGLISGILIKPLSYTVPSYGKGLAVGKKWVDLKNDTLTMPGELMLPTSGDAVPLVILIHGSGPNDKDETIGPNKVFYDLALGLAKQGIATYRYDKRSKVYPDLFKGQFDIYDETVSDALKAIELFATDTTYHFTKIIALGHSLGGFAMPMIADSSNYLDGAILFSANARPLNELMVYQVKYLSAIDGDTSKAERKVINDAKQRCKNISDGLYDEDTPAKQLMAYWPGKFWKGISDYDQLAVAKEINKPMLIMQGEMDYQITMTDFKLWQQAMQGKSNVKLISYPGLTHLFTPTTKSMSSPADYFIPQNVDEKCIIDISDWIRGL